MACRVAHFVELNRLLGYERVGVASVETTRAWISRLDNLKQLEKDNGKVDRSIAQVSWLRWKKYVDTMFSVCSFKIKAFLDTARNIV